MWLGAHHSDKKPLEVLARELAPAGTGMGLYFSIQNTIKFADDNLPENKFGNIFNP